MLKSVNMMLKRAKLIFGIGITVSLLQMMFSSGGDTLLQLATSETNSASSLCARLNCEYTQFRGVFLKDVPIIYLVTPTGSRLERKADLTRLSYTLRLVQNLHWIVVEDTKSNSKSVASVLELSKLSYTHLSVPTPLVISSKSFLPSIFGRQTRGMAQRNAGIDWIRQNAEEPGVVYFADDDNTYDLRLFEEMRSTKKVSVWPVAFVAGLKYEAPIVKNGKVTSWYTTFQRTFATDMAGFAISIRLLREHPEVEFRNKPRRMEPDFLTQFGITLDDLEPKANNCTQILVWHTRTQISSTENEEDLRKTVGFYRKLDV